MRGTVMRRWQAIRDFLFGMTGYSFLRHARQLKHESEALFFVVTWGDLVGIPIMPPVYSLHLLPYVFPEIESWKRQLARRKEFWERDEYDLHDI
jgi:hypothetical protein